MVQYAGLVERVARRFSGIEPFEDLVQVGFIGLLNALGKFDPYAGVRFNTYATYLVAGEIKHYLRDRSQVIRHPAWLQELRHKVNKAAQTIQQAQHRQPTEREIADALGISESAVREVFQTQEMLKVASLDAPTPGEDDSSSESDRLDAAAFCPEQLSVEDRVLLEQAMKQLRDLERQVLLLFHFESKNQTEIAAELGISCNYVSHILRQSLAKLRKILTTEEEKDRLLKRQVNDHDVEIIDAETGAYTESYFHMRLQEEVHRARSGGSYVALVMIRFHGLDTMRRFYGEQSTIDFLTDASDFFKSNLRRLDVVARFGPTGFGIILPATAHNVHLVSKRLLTQASHWMSNRFTPESAVSMEIGHVCAPENGKTVPKLLGSVVYLPASEGASLRAA